MTENKTEKLQFDSIHHALEWFFNNRWIKPPADAKSGSMLNIQTNPRAICPGRIINTFMAINENVTALLPKEQYVVQNEYMKISRVQTDVAEFLGLACDKTVRNMRDRAVKKLRLALLRENILSNKIFCESPVYLRGAV